MAPRPDEGQTPHQDGSLYEAAVAGKNAVTELVLTIATGGPSRFDVISSGKHGGSVGVGRAPSEQQAIDTARRYKTKINKAHAEKKTNDVVTKIVLPDGSELAD